MTTSELIGMALDTTEAKTFGWNMGNKFDENNLYSSYSAYMQLDIILSENNTCDVQVMTDTDREQYANLVAQARLINKNFSVDLTKVQQSCLTDTQPDPQPTPTTSADKKPGVPDTGNEQQSDSSAQILTVALGSIGLLATVVALVVLAKRYMLSPLKRR